MNGSSSHGFMSVICITSYKDMVFGLQFFCWSFRFLVQVLSLNNDNEQSDTGLRQGPLAAANTNPKGPSARLHVPSAAAWHTLSLLRATAHAEALPSLWPKASSPEGARGLLSPELKLTKDGTSSISVALSAQHLGLWIAMRRSQFIFNNWINKFRILTTFASSMIARSEKRSPCDLL